MLTAGVIGVGYWGPNIIRNFYAHPEIIVKSCSDLKETRLENIKSNYPTIHTTKNYLDIINDPQIDLIAICTPVDTHFEISKAVINAGKNVLIEKPMTSTSAQANELIKLAEKNKVHIFVDHTFVFTGAVKKIKELIDKNELGDLYYFDSVRVNLGLFQHDVNVIWDLAPHDISIMHYLFNRTPQSIVATGADHIGNGLEDVAYMTIYFTDSLIAHIHTNWLSPAKIRNTLIAGSKKMIVWDDNEPSEKIRIYDKGIDIIQSDDQMYNTFIQYRTGDMNCPKLDGTEALKAETQNITDVLLRGAKPMVDGYAGLMVVKILEASQKSIKQRGLEIKI